jgi:hypothetical protein
MSAKSSRLSGKNDMVSPNPTSSINESPPRQRKSPRTRMEATKAKLSKIKASVNSDKHEILESDNDNEGSQTSKEPSPSIPPQIRLGYFTTPVKKVSLLFFVSKLQ